MICVHTCTLPQPTFIHTGMETHQRKKTARLLILLLQNVWQFCWTSLQKIHPPVLQWARDSEREQPAMKASTAWTVNTAKKQSHDKDCTYSVSEGAEIPCCGFCKMWKPRARVTKCCPQCVNISTPDPQLWVLSPADYWGCRRTTCIILSPSVLFPLKAEEW